MPDERMLQGVMPSTMHMVRDSLEELYKAAASAHAAKAHSGVPLASCTQAGGLHR